MERELSYAERSRLCSNPAARDLLALMDEKESNLALAADVTTKNRLLEIADLLGPQICVLKTHADIVSDFDRDLTAGLRELARKHRFFIFEDRKFADIGSTVAEQYAGGLHEIVRWSHITNAHTVPGPGVIEGLKKTGLTKDRGLLLIAEMSSQGALTNEAYAKETLRLAEQHDDFVIGFITQRRLTDNPRFIHFTPGVHLESKGDSLGQRYLTPEDVVLRSKSDVIIVGRGIIAAEDPEGVAARYREAGFAAYRQRVDA